MQYDLNQLADPRKFQRLVNAILVARFGEDARLTPIQGKDGGSDGETAEGNPFFEFEFQTPPLNSPNPLVQTPRPGRYIFQAKYHRTGDQRLSELRSLIVAEFRSELLRNVLNRSDRESVNYFFLVTNVSASDEALKKVDDIRSTLLENMPHLHADVWWQERITTSLDWSPDLWQAFPEIFPGGVAPPLGLATSTNAEGLPRTFRLAIAKQYERDRLVKFRQIELEKRLLDLFVDLDATFSSDEVATLSANERVMFNRQLFNSAMEAVLDTGIFRLHRKPDSALQLLLDDDKKINRILLEGGPGQGKSTITQMVAQIYREKFLPNKDSVSRDINWHRLSKLRLPIRIELREFAHWLNQGPDRSIDQYIARLISLDSGGASVSVEDIHQLIEGSSIILILDGLDEIGNNELRDKVIDCSMDSITRFEAALKADAKVILTTRPPAMSGRWNKLEGFVRVLLTPMEGGRVDEYLDRWLDAQIETDDDKCRIKRSFNSRREESHVEALARNPMQLSVLLQFIYLKGEAFPDRRAELYRDYFQIVIDRDVEKSPELRDHREIVEGLHSYLGFRLHGTAEIEPTRRSLSRGEVIGLAGEWLEQEGHAKALAASYFALGEERFGLIVALSGEGHETTYGFEVQPIQEYFAAAYVSNRLPDGRAHDVFGALIHRDYWKEVALFLAGLRRPNEKADLVARAKAADKDASGMLAHSGRSIVLQLLREGVLSQPKHVQTEAVRFVFGFLEESELFWIQSPRTLMDSLADLAKLYGGEETVGKVKQFAQLSFELEDRELITLSQGLAGKVLPKDDYIQVVLGYQGEAEDTRGLVRITCPFDVPGIITELGKHRAYWDGISSTVFARRFWLAVAQAGVVPDVIYPADAHMSLVVEFCGGLGGQNLVSGLPPKLEGHWIPGILKLYGNLQQLNYVLAAREKGIQQSEIRALVEQAKETRGDFEGAGRLPAEIGQCLQGLIEASDKMLSQLADGRARRIRESWREYLQCLGRYVRRPGLVGWVAVRCTTELLRVPPPVLLRLRSQGIISGLIEEVRKFYPGVFGVFFSGGYLMEGLRVGIPRMIRMEEDGELHSVEGVIAEVVLGEKEDGEGCDLVWVQGLPIPPVLIRPVVDLCRGDVEALLRFLGSQPTALGEMYYVERRLRVQETRRILKICRASNDSMILRGAAVALQCAKISRVAEAEVLIKILSAAPWSRLVQQIFDTGEGIGRQRRSSDLDALAKDVAYEVVKKPKLYSFRLVNRAATYLAEVEATRNKPLFEEWPDLLQAG